MGGTSVASPSLAGIVNNSNNRFGQGPQTGGYYTTEENNLLYGQLFANSAYSGNFYDVTTGSNGSGHNATTGYVQCTGIETPRAATSGSSFSAELNTHCCFSRASHYKGAHFYFSQLPRARTALCISHSTSHFSCKPAKRSAHALHYPDVR